MLARIFIALVPESGKPFFRVHDPFYFHADSGSVTNKTDSDLALLFRHFSSFFDNDFHPVY